MEISLQSNLISANFNPSPLLSRPFCKRRSGPKLISSVSIRPHLIPYKGLSIQSPCFQLQLQRNFKFDGIVSTKTTCTKIGAQAPCCFPYHSHVGRINGIDGVYKFQKRSRSVGVTSEVGGSMYPSSELNVKSKIRGILFYAVTSLAAIILFVLMLAAHPFILLFDRYQRKAHHLVAKMWALITVYPFFKIEVDGLENLPSPGTPAVYVSNHQSFLDIYALLTIGRSFKFISKTSIFLYPIVGWAMSFLGTIPIKRMDSRSQLDCLKRCIELVKKGTSVFFFPEGTRSRDGKLGVFKKGAFILATKTRVPVVPVTLIGTGIIMPAGEEGRLNTGSVKIIIQRPIEGNDPGVLCTEARSRIADALVQHGCEI